MRDHESDFFALLTAARAAAGAGDPEKAGLYYRRALAMRPALEALQAEALPFTKENS